MTTVIVASPAAAVIPLRIPARHPALNRAWLALAAAGSFAYFTAAFACAYALIGALA